MGNERDGRKDNGRHRSVRFDKWIHDEVETIAKVKDVSFTDMVNHLLEYQLNMLGYTKAQYEAKTFGLKRLESNERYEGHFEAGLALAELSKDESPPTSTKRSLFYKTQFPVASGIGKRGNLLRIIEKIPEDKTPEAKTLLSPFLDAPVESHEYWDPACSNKHDELCFMAEMIRTEEGLQGAIDKIAPLLDGESPTQSKKRA